MMNRLKHIKAVFNRKIPAEELVVFCDGIGAKVFNNLNFAPPQAPPPPVDEATLKAANTALASANAAALDGGKRAIAQRNHQKEVVVKLLKQLATYVETNCKDDMTIFLSSGFTAAASTKPGSPPVSESFRNVAAGANSGEMVLTLMRDPRAKSYELRMAQVGPEGVPGPWRNQPIADTRPATTVSGLTPGGTYVFQLRALTKAGYTDWSDSVTRIVI
jgi:hypothetical protein